MTEGESKTGDGPAGRATRRGAFSVRALRRQDDAGVGRVIQEVMTEYGASGPGFSIHDEEVACMSAAYSGERAFFLVVAAGDEVVGGSGIAPLDGGPSGVCELKKMYFLPVARGLGLGRELLHRCLDAARDRGFERCYIETHERMVEARGLYESAGFEPLDGPMGETGHHGCNRWYLLDL